MFTTNLHHNTCLTLFNQLMSDFKAKMHIKFDFRWGSAPVVWRLQRSPRIKEAYF